MENNANEQEIPLIELYDYLKNFHLSESLYEIGAINAIYKYGFAKINEKDIPDRILQWQREWIGRGYSEKNLTLLLSRLARFLILSGANDTGTRILTTGTSDFINALNMVGLVRDEDVEEAFGDKGNSFSIIGRLASWQLPLQETRLIPIARAFILFADIPSALSLCYPIDDKMKEYFSIGAKEFIWSGLALWFQTNGALHESMKIEVEGLKKYVSIDNLNIFRDLSSGTIQNYQTILRGGDGNLTDKKTEYYALDPFIKIPIVKIERSIRFGEGSWLVPQPKYLLDRSCYGIFHLLADKEKQLSELAGKNANPFRIAFGDLYKEYILRQLQTASSTCVVLDLDREDFFKSKKRIPDIALIAGDKCILFEVKTSILTLSARTYFDSDQLEKEVCKPGGSFDKAIKQLNQFNDSILSGEIADKRFENVKRVVKILVCYEEIPMLNLLVLPLVRKYYGTMGDDLQLGNVRDIETMSTLLDSGGDLPALLINKVDSPDKKEWMISTFLQQDFKKIDKHNKMLHDKFREVMQDIGIIAPVTKG